MAATAVHIRSHEPARRRRLLRVGDDRLVARVRAGDDGAFEIIYDRYYRGLLAFCGHMLGSRQEAEDALQQTFASAYRALRGGAGDDRAAPVAVHDRQEPLPFCPAGAARAGLRRRDRRRGGRSTGMAAQIQQRADLRDLVEELQRLPDDQRAALVLFELGDESHEQIAAVLGVRREKVKALVFQAREALLRARAAREAPCVEIREQLATLTGRVPRRSMLRSHIDRCPGCAEFEREVRHQRAALAAILPLVPTVGLKASVLGVSLGGGGAVALGGAGRRRRDGRRGRRARGRGRERRRGRGNGRGGRSGCARHGRRGDGRHWPGHRRRCLASLPAKGAVAKILAVMALGGGGAQAQVHSEHQARPAASHQPATPPSRIVRGPVVPARRLATAGARRRPPRAIRRPHRARRPRRPCRPPPRRPAAPAPLHAPAASIPAATPTPSGPPSGAAPASDDATPAASQAPAAAPAPDAAPAPSAPAPSATPPATTDPAQPRRPPRRPRPPAASAAPASPASTDTAAPPRQRGARDRIRRGRRRRRTPTHAS